MAEGDCGLQDLLPRGPDTPTCHRLSWESVEDSPDKQEGPFLPCLAVEERMPWPVRIVVGLEESRKIPAKDACTEELSMTLWELVWQEPSRNSDISPKGACNSVLPCDRQGNTLHSAASEPQAIGGNWTASVQHHVHEMHNIHNEA